MLTRNHGFRFLFHYLLRYRNVDRENTTFQQRNETHFVLRLPADYAMTKPPKIAAVTCYLDRSVPVTSSRTSWRRHYDVMWRWENTLVNWWLFLGKHAKAGRQLQYVMAHRSCAASKDIKVISLIRISLHDVKIGYPAGLFEGIKIVGIISICHC